GEKESLSSISEVGAATARTGWQGAASYLATHEGAKPPTRIGYWPLARLQAHSSQPIAHGSASCALCHVIAGKAFEQHLLRGDGLPLARRSEVVDPLGVHLPGLAVIVE